jgi:hypothetical protein
LIVYLKSDEVTRPTTVSAESASPTDTTGCVTTNIRHGELFLQVKGQSDQRFRLRWEREPVSDRARKRSLPAGTYVVTGYRHVALADDGTEWIWSTTSPGYRELVVKAGETVHLAVKRTFGVRARAFEKKGQHRVALAFQAEKRLGSTIYRDGKRISIQWQCLDAEGAVLGDGPMKYG